MTKADAFRKLIRESVREVIREELRAALKGITVPAQQTQRRPPQQSETKRLSLRELHNPTQEPSARTSMPSTGNPIEDIMRQTRQSMNPVTAAQMMIGGNGGQGYAPYQDDPRSNTTYQQDDSWQPMGFGSDDYEVDYSTQPAPAPVQEQYIPQHLPPPPPGTDPWGVEVPAVAMLDNGSGYGIDISKLGFVKNAATIYNLAEQKSRGELT